MSLLRSVSGIGKSFSTGSRTLASVPNLRSLLGLGTLDRLRDVALGGIVGGTLCSKPCPDLVFVRKLFIRLVMSSRVPRLLYLGQASSSLGEIISGLCA